MLRNTNLILQIKLTLVFHISLLRHPGGLVVLHYFLKPACAWFDSRQVAVTRDIPTRFSLCIFLESNRS